MESNKETELTSKIETDSQMESWMTARREEGEGVEGLSNRKKDSWTWTTVWSLLGGGGCKGTIW